MMHLPVSRSWLFSRTAQRVYLVSAVLDLAFLGTRMGVATAMNAAGVFTLPLTVQMAVGLLSIPAAIGTAVLTVGMTYCWLAVGGSCGRKLVWILVVLSYYPISMPIYYFAFYRRLASQENSEPAVAVLATP
jgi:hypothetical protein